jgi:phosphoribosylpyrophosphate synthetase
VPVDNLDAGVIGVSYLAGKQLVNPMIVSPDAGGVYRAKKFLEGCVLAFWFVHVAHVAHVAQDMVSFFPASTASCPNLPDWQ